MTNPKLKAYYVAELPDHEYARVTFGYCENHLRHRWGDDLCEPPPIDRIIERRPDLDIWVRIGYVPPLELVYREGFHWPCANCGSIITRHTLEPVNTVIENGKHLYCSRACHDEHQARRSQQHVIRQQVKAWLRSRYPGIRGTDEGYLHVSFRDWPNVRVSFYFPGGISAVDWESRDPEMLDMYVHDVIAWVDRYGGSPEMQAIAAARQRDLDRKLEQDEQTPSVH